MITEEQDLSSEQRELVAVGASIGAGCHPCVDHHLEAGANAGLDGERLLAAVTSAERVRAEAAVRIGDHVRETLGPRVTAPAMLSPLEEALASFGAALAANDVTNIKRQMRLAAEQGGASRLQLQQTIEAAHKVQENAMRIHRREAERLLDGLVMPVAMPQDEAAQSGDGCGCGASDEPAAAPRAQEPVAETSDAQEHVAAGQASDRAAGKPSMAECFGSAGNGEAVGPATMMAHCRQMFGGAFAEPDSPAETNEPPTATAAQGCTGTREV